jgi:hypothetical protein
LPSVFPRTCRKSDHRDRPNKSPSRIRNTLPRPRPICLVCIERTRKDTPLRRKSDLPNKPGRKNGCYSRRMVAEDFRSLSWPHSWDIRPRLPRNGNLSSEESSVRSPPQTPRVRRAFWGLGEFS